jgi:hypothetical protein
MKNTEIAEGEQRLRRRRAQRSEREQAVSSR